MNSSKAIHAERILKMINAYQDIKRLGSYYQIALIGVMAMVILGGYTRLTGSGLSMVNWSLYNDFLPPLTLQAWRKVFATYQGSPEFLMVNRWMGLEDFKEIFWLEYFHRLLGRILGLLFLIPLLLSFIKPSLESFRLRTLGLFLLGGLQGGLGWYMVKSGLVKNPQVSHFRLAAHLVAAFLTAGCLLWTIFQFKALERMTTLAGEKVQKGHPGINFFSAANSLGFMPLVLMTFTIVFGAFTAGLKGGFMHNTFPLMDGALIPQHLFQGQQFSKFYQDPALVQWIHRLLALLTLVYGIWWARSHRRALSYKHGAQAALFFENRSLKRSLTLFQFALLAQVTLGILTLILRVPTTLGVMHQMGALISLIAYLNILYKRELRFIQATLLQGHEAGQGAVDIKIQKSATAI